MAAALLCWPLAAAAAPPPADGLIDLASQATARIDGAAINERAASAVAAAGDVNGDGHSDVIVGAPGTASAYVVFGRGAGGIIPLGSLGAGGFQIVGASGLAVAGAGDVNGDGRADVIVGNASADNNGETDSGSAYVVFGKPDSATVSVGAPGAWGFRLDGGLAGDRAGSSVGGAGDMNGDGRSEIVVGAPFADVASDRPGGTRAIGVDVGTAFVVFGKATTDTVVLTNSSAQFMRIDGAVSGDMTGNSVARVGDVNGDGRMDVVVGSPGASGAAGSAAVVFGEPTGTRVGLEELGARGFIMAGGAAGDGAGTSVAGTGDVDADGRPDVVVGAPGADSNFRTGSGSAYIVSGRTGGSSVSLAAPGANDVRIDGAATGHSAGLAVAGPGDVSGDGRPDVLVGAHLADNRGRADSGSTYLLYGKPPGQVVDLSLLGTQGLRIDGAEAGSQSGSALAGAGDFNSDATSDVLVGAPLAENSQATDAGSAYVVNGFVTPPPPPPPAPPSAPVPPPPPAPCSDCDADGYLAIVDCNEASAAIHPGAVDIPGNKVDEDCSGSPAPYPRLDSTITYSFSYRGRNTVITELLLRTARAGSTIRMTCTGRGCRFKTKTRKVAKNARRVALSSLVRTSRLRPGARLEVRVTKRATVGILKRLTMRAGRRPTQADLCVRPGTSKPSRCPL